MEIATLAQMFPGRFHMGFGHGVDFWIEQVGAVPTSWMSSLREVVIATTKLLAGESVSMDGDHVHLDAVQLAHPAKVMPPISLGVRGPRSMALGGRSGRWSDLCRMVGPAVPAAGSCPDRRHSQVHRIRPGQRDVDALEAMMAEKMALPRFASQLAAYGDEQLPLEELVIGGDPVTWVDQAQKWIDAGASAVVFCPLPTDPVELPL